MIGHDRHVAHDQPLPYISVHQACMNVMDHLTAVKNTLKYFTRPYTCIRGPLCITHKQRGEHDSTMGTMGT